jgi:hypothetical protein
VSTQFQHAGGALVPVKPEDAQEAREQLRDERVNSPRLDKYLHRTLDSIADLDRNSNLKIHNEMIRCVAYYDGRWDGEVRNGEWVDNPAIDGEILPRDNEYKKQIDKLHMEMCRNRITYEVESAQKSSEMKEAADFASHRLKVNQDRVETEPFVQGENMSLLLKTIAFRYTFFDQNADCGETRTEAKVIKQLTQGTSVLVCRTCGASQDRLPGEREPLDIPDRPAQIEPAVESAINREKDTLDASIGTPCPRCGDTERKEISVPESTGLKFEYEEKPRGRVVTIRPDSTMVQLDLNARDIQSSSFLRWRLVLRRCDWEAMFPNVKIPSTKESDEARRRSEYQSQPSNSEGWSSDESEGGDQFEKIEGELVWLDPKVYARYRNKQDEMLKGGQVLPEGEPLPPEGACIARIGNKILDIYPSDKNKCWAMCVYGLREHALHGSGTIALLGPQDTLSNLNAYILAHSFYRAAGREFIRSDGIEGGQLAPIGKASVVTNAPEEVVNVAGWAYGRSQPESLSSEVFAFREAQRGSIQDAAGTSSLSMQGAADMKALGTATGVEASRDQAVGRMIPNRKLQAYMGVEWCKQVLELEKENYTAEMFLDRAGESNEKGEVEYTERGVRAFFNSKVSDYMITPSNFMPTTPAQEKANAADFGQIAGQLAQLPNAPELISLIAPRFGVEYDVNEWGAAQRSASMRLEEYARVAGIVESGGYAPSPEMVDVVLANCAEWARVNPEMDSHKAFMDFLTDWWLSDEGRNASGLLRMVIQQVYALHKQGLVYQAQQEAAAGVAAQAPMMAAQEQITEEQQAKQMEMADVQHAQQQEHAAQDALLAKAGKDAGVLPDNQPKD